MKKAILVLIAGLQVLGASAQYNTRHLPVQGPLFDHSFHRATVVPTDFSGGTANKTTVVAPRWYNHAQVLGTAYGVNIYSSALSNYNILWQDSSVRYTETGGGVSPSGINWLSMGEAFHPQTNLYNGNTAANRGKLRISNTDAYMLDSVMVRGVYERRYNTYVDTLLLVFVTETATTKFPFFSYGGTVFQDHGVDSFVALLWSNTAYQTKPVTQISYTVGGNSLSAATLIKVPLTQAIYVDSLADGSHLIKAAPHISVPAGCKVTMSVTFKSGTSYTAGTPITDYNYFAFLSHEIVEDDYVFYTPGDFNMSYVCPKDSSKTSINATLNIYIPSIAYTAPFGAELHDISWKASCTTCSAVSVSDIDNTVTIGDAYPNPANSSINIPIAAKANANVNISLSNMLGQVLKTQELGNIGAGQSRTAVFNTSDLAPGIYLYTVESNGERMTNRVLIAH